LTMSRATWFCEKDQRNLTPKALFSVRGTIGSLDNVT
jgi:hypothetical protein